MFSLLDTKNKDTLAFRKQIINMLQSEHYDKVYIIGHSLGTADCSVFNAINKDAKIICSFFNEDDYVTKSNTLKKMNLDYEFVQDVELY